MAKKYLIMNQIEKSEEGHNVITEIVSEEDYINHKYYLWRANIKGIENDIYIKGYFIIGNEEETNNFLVNVFSDHAPNDKIIMIMHSPADEE